MDALPVFERITATVDDHALQLHVSGADRLEALLSLIGGAQKTLQLVFYIFADDAVARRVQAALITAALRGVRVTLIVDGFGTASCPDTVYEPLVAAGVRFARFLPRWGRRYLLRNHQKMVIADRVRAIIGGSNISTQYFEDAPDGSSWHDLFLSVEGPAITRLSRYHDSLARWMARGDGGILSLLRVLQRRSERKGPLRWLFNGPFQRLSPLTRAIRHDVAGAATIDMIQAYFAPNWGMLRKLGRVSRRGGRLRIITAARSDNTVTIAAARHCYRRLLRNRAELAEYQPQMLHMKLLIVDNAVYIGSANFDMRSLYINAEVMLRIEDQGFATAARALVDAHMPYCDIITRAEHRERSGWFTRMRWLVSYFLVSTLDFTVTRRLNLRRG
jgi:cardiolipin synthase A/B